MVWPHHTCSYLSRTCQKYHCTVRCIISLQQAGNLEGNGKGGKRDGNGNKVGKGKGSKRDGNGNKDGKGKGGKSDGNGN
jgi:hypothetical protein